MALLAWTRFDVEFVIISLGYHLSALASLIAHAFTLQTAVYWSIRVYETADCFFYASWCTSWDGQPYLTLSECYLEPGCLLKTQRDGSAGMQQSDRLHQTSRLFIAQVFFRPQRMLAAAVFVACFQSRACKDASIMRMRPHGRSGFQADPSVTLPSIVWAQNRARKQHMVSTIYIVYTMFFYSFLVQFSFKRSSVTDSAVSPVQVYS